MVVLQWYISVYQHWRTNLRGAKNMLAHVLTSAASWNSDQPLLTYLVPEQMEAELHRGQLVSVPYGERLVEGIVWELLSAEQVALDKDIVLRPLHEILDTEPALLPHQQ